MTFNTGLHKKRPSTVYPKIERTKSDDEDFELPDDVENPQL
jgi:hypothetical protein